MLDYLAIGHVTDDLWSDGHVTPGGTVMYAALAARRLVARVGVLTAASDALDVAQVFPDIAVYRLPTPTTTQFRNIYTQGGRIQYVRPAPVALDAAAFRQHALQARIVHLAPVCDEVRTDILDVLPPDTFVGVTPQGWLRRWDAEGRVFAREWHDAERVLPRANAVVFSIEDVNSDWSTALRWAALAPLLIVTLGAEGCMCFLQGRPYHIPAPQVVEIDPTGAGDIFAAALFIALQRGHHPLAACRFANCIAAQSVTRPQLQGLPTTADIDRCSTMLDNC